MENDSERRPAAGAGTVAEDVTAAPRSALDLLRWLRATERGHVADLLHDGPIQDLAVAALLLGEVRHGLGPSAGEDLDTIARHVDAAGRSLRRLQDMLSPFSYLETGLVAALQSRTAWLLNSPLTVTAGQGTAALPEQDILAVADIVELVTARVASTETVSRAHAEVRADRRLIIVVLDLIPTTPAAGGAPPGLAMWVHDLATAVQARASLDEHGGGIRVHMAISRPGWISLPGRIRGQRRFHGLQQVLGREGLPDDRDLRVGQAVRSQRGA